MSEKIHENRAAIPSDEWLHVLTVEARATVSARKVVMRELDAVAGRGLNAAYGPAGKRLNLSADRVKKLYALWRKAGEYGLIDHRECGGCGLGSCKNKRQRSLLHPLTVQEWVRISETNQSTQTKGERSGAWAWERFIERLRAGDEVPGLGLNGTKGTWRDLWVRIYPAMVLPPVCRWSVTSPPPGHSEQNFRTQAKNRVAAETVLMQRSLAKARESLPQVRLDWGTVRPLEVIVIDDKRLDFLAWMRVGNRVEIVEVWLLVCMDAFSRRILWAEVFPRFTRKDGTQAGISHRDVQHLFAKVLATYGVPTKYKQTWIVENAAAALPKVFDDVVERVTDGQVDLSRSGLWDGKAMVGGFLQRGGSPRGKAVLESFFGHRLDVALGDVKGQVGSRYQLKPGETVARLQYAQKLAKKVGDVATDAEMEALMPVESLPKAKEHLLRALGEIENRERHELQGFEKVTLWRPDVGDEWRAMTHPSMGRLLERPNGLELVNALLAEPGCSLQRVETCRERWERCFDPADFEALNFAAFADLWMDTATVNYDGTGVFSCKVPRGEAVEFRSRVHTLQAGARVTVRFDLDNLDLGAVLLDERGRVAGRAEFEGRRTWGDEDALKRQLGQYAAAQAAIINGARERHQGRDQMLQEVVEREGQTRLLTTITERAAGVRQDAASSEALVEAMAGRGKRTISEPSAAELMAAELAAAGLED